jgi:uncharacterized protein YndB with AHSA1/START domain
VGEGAATREVAITRVFDAPRELVWKEWTEPECLAAWWGKRGWSTPPEGITMDVLRGGVFRVTSVSDEDGSGMVQEGAYREVVELERLVIEEAAEGAWHTVRDMKLPSTVHTARPWRIHEITPDFRLSDVWALPTPCGSRRLPATGPTIRGG